jgi:hypothetical protein
MISSEKLHVQGDPTKNLKDFDVKIPEGTLQF